MTNRSAYTVIGDRHYSYQTIIRQTLPGGLTLGNITKYSVTTSKHQSMARVKECDVLLDGVPKGTTDLLPLAVERGLIEQDGNLTAWISQHYRENNRCFAEYIPRP